MAGRTATAIADHQQRSSLEIRPSNLFEGLPIDQFRCRPLTAERLVRALPYLGTSSISGAAHQPRDLRMGERDRLVAPLPLRRQDAEANGEAGPKGTPQERRVMGEGLEPIASAVGLLPLTRGSFLTLFRKPPRFRGSNGAALG